MSLLLLEKMVLNLQHVRDGGGVVCYHIHCVNYTKHHAIYHLSFMTSSPMQIRRPTCPHLTPRQAPSPPDQVAFPLRIVEHILPAPRPPRSQNRNPR